jgi:hypothetical protein
VDVVVFLSHHLLPSTQMMAFAASSVVCITLTDHGQLAQWIKIHYAKEAAAPPQT